METVSVNRSDSGQIFAQFIATALYCDSIILYSEKRPDPNLNKY